MGGLESQRLDWMVFEVGRLLDAVLLDGRTKTEHTTAQVAPRQVEEEV